MVGNGYGGVTKRLEYSFSFRASATRNLKVVL